MEAEPQISCSDEPAFLSEAKTQGSDFDFHGAADARAAAERLRSIAHDLPPGHLAQAADLIQTAHELDIAAVDRRALESSFGGV